MEFVVPDHPPRTIRHRRRRNELPNITENLSNLIKFFENSNISHIHSKRISTKTPNVAGSRSSAFVGVSKNGENWQALINNGKNKKYIGTFSTELEAAVAYDFYCIALHGFKSKCNFSYAKQTVMDMIESYHSNHSKFDPVPFTSRMLHNSV